MTFSLAPSILAADQSRLGEEVALVADLADRVHIDVMDGHFVPNLSMGPAVVHSLQAATHLPLEVHLMIEEPIRYLDNFAKAGAHSVAFHIEVVDDPQKAIDAVRSAGCKVGIAHNPGTDLSIFDRYLSQLDLVICMTVEPGFGGQGFIDEALAKVRSITDMVRKVGSAVDIEVDGGINVETARLARQAGADVFVAGSAIFGSADPRSAAKAICKAVEEAG